MQGFPWIIIVDFSYLKYISELPGYQAIVITRASVHGKPESENATDFLAKGVIAWFQTVKV